MVLEHVIIARRPQEATLEGLVDVEVATRQDMEEPVALEEVRFKLTGWAVVNPKNIWIQLTGCFGEKRTLFIPLWNKFYFFQIPFYFFLNSVFSILIFLNSVF